MSLLQHAAAEGEWESGDNEGRFSFSFTPFDSCTMGKSNVWATTVRWSCSPGMSSNFVMVAGSRLQGAGTRTAEAAPLARTPSHKFQSAPFACPVVLHNSNTFGYCLPLLLL